MFEVTLVTTDADKATFLHESFEARMPLFNPDTVRHRNFIVATNLSGMAVGLAAFRDATAYRENCISLAYLDVDPEFRQKGIASKIATALFDYAEKHSKGIFVSWYEPLGALYLKPVLRRFAENRPIVPLWDNN